MSSKDTKNASRDKRFEEHLEVLEQIVHDLEGGELPLEDSLERYQLGVESLRHCHRILREVEHRVEVLVAGSVEEDGEALPPPAEIGVDVEIEAGPVDPPECSDDDAQLF